MSQHTRRLVRLVSALGLGVGTAAGFYYLKGGRSSEDETKNIARKVFVDKHTHLGKVLASWTTNFEPSVKWDSNWDRYTIIT